MVMTAALTRLDQSQSSVLRLAGFAKVDFSVCLCCDINPTQGLGRIFVLMLG